MGADGRARVLGGMVLVSFLLAGRAAWADLTQAQAAYTRGVQQERARNYQAAIREFQDSLAADPRYVYANKEMGNCDYYQGDKAGALENYDKYLAVVPSDSRVKALADYLRGQVGGPSNPAPAGAGAKANDLYVNPLGFLFGIANLGYERSLGHDQTWKVQGEYLHSGTSTDGFTAMGAGAGWRFYFDPRHPMTGWFLGPEVDVLDLTFNYQVTTTVYQYGYAVGTQTSNQSTSGLFYGVSAEVGYQWLLGDSFLITPGATVGYFAGSLNLGSGAPTLGFGGISAGGELNLGYLF